MDYLDRARILGHNVEALKNGEMITGLVSLESLEHFKELFGDYTADQRSEFSSRLQTLPDDHPVIEPFRNLLDYVHGTRQLTAEDSAFARQIFPLNVTAVSGADVTISSDESVGPAAPPYILNAGTLTFAGGSLTVRNTVCQISADNLVIRAGGDLPYHIGIFGAPGATGSAGAAGNSTPGQAPNGRDSMGGSPGVCTGASDGEDGQNGAPGGVGNPGGPGGAGAPSLNAVIVIGALDPAAVQSFVVTTQSGPGGAGGTGGTGGAGQQAGNGGNGCSSGCEGTDGGNGGLGGAGGNGGPGGVGGPGADGLPIQISFPGAAKPALQTNAVLAPPGPGGPGGAGGLGGAGGSGGGSGKHHSDGSQGSPGASGLQGPTGTPGTRNGANGQISISYT